jgi:hypothetical protein
MLRTSLLTATQRGTAGEELFTACVTLTSNGDLELFRPTTDDDHTDVTIGKRGMVPALAIQVKTALSLTIKGFAVARMAFPEGKARQHPAFVYAIVFVRNAAIESAWIVPSADFNRLAYRGAGRRGKGIELQFMASPTRTDKWSGFRCARLEVGPRLLQVIAGLPASAPPPRLEGLGLVLRRTPPGRDRSVVRKSKQPDRRVDVLR